MKHEILNSNGDPIRLNSQESFRAKALQAQYNRELKNAMPGSEFQNDLGYEVDITTLTQLLKSITEQKFYTVPFADYVPVVVGEGAWASETLKYQSFNIGDDFESGVLNTGSSNSRLAEVDANVSPVRNPIINWGKQISWSFMDLQQAARAGNWDLVSAKERSRKTNWDLGLQEIAFWGLEQVDGVKGLLTQDNVSVNTTVITKYISAMNATEFQAFLSALLEAYRVNAKRTAQPTHFIIPEADYNGLAVAADETYPLKTKLERIEEALRLTTMNPNFKVMPTAYADQSTNAAVTGLNKNRYTLTRYDEDSIRMDIPVDYTNTLQNTINGFHFQNVGYGQFTGVQTYRPDETLYLDWAA